MSNTDVTRGWHPKGRRVLLTTGERAYVVDTGGCKPPVVLLHGIMASSWAWRHTVAALAPRYRVVALCLRGFGWSDKPHGIYSVETLAEFVRLVLSALGIQSCHLVGNSLGGAVSMRLALDHPLLIRRLALVAPAGAPLTHVKWLLRLQHRRLGPLYDRVGTRRAYRLLLRTMAYAGRPVSDETMDAFMTPLACGGAVRAAASISRRLPIEAQRLYDEASQIRHSTLLCWGTHDLLMPYWLAAGVSGRLPNARFVSFPGIGHCPMEECPSEFESALLQHLREARREGVPD